MPTPTPELGLQKAVDADDTADYLETSLGSSLTTLDSLFNNVSGHTHQGAHQGGPITTLPPPGSITSSMIADGTIAASDLDPALGNFGAGAVWSPATTQGGTNPSATVVCNRYIKVGRLVLVTGVLEYTGAGSAGNDIEISTLPVTPVFVYGYFALGSFLYVRGGVGQYSGAVVNNSAVSIKFAAGGSDGTNLLTGFLGNAGGPSFAIASGDVLSFTLLYEANA